MVAKNSVMRWILSPILIGIIFWFTDGLLSYCGGILSTKAWIITKTIALPAVSIVVLLAVVRKGAFFPNVIPALSFLGVIAVWVLGPIYVLFMGLLFGRGATLMELKELPMLIFYPLATISAATYSGGLGGLILTAICLPVAGMIIESKLKKQK